MDGVIMTLDGGKKCSCGGNCISKETDSSYRLLETILGEAYNQAASGKGKDRHAVDGEAFEDQQICEIARRLKGNSAAGPLFQAVKKIYESGRLDGERGISELLGAVNYIVAAIIVIRENNGK